MEFTHYFFSRIGVRFAARRMLQSNLRFVMLATQHHPELVQNICSGIPGGCYVSIYKGNLLVASCTQHKACSIERTDAEGCAVCRDAIMRRRPRAIGRVAS
jgi:hypothetical protein